MPDSEKIAVAPDLVFDAITAGAPGAPLVLLLHGFAESLHCWHAQVTALGDMGYRAIAPSQLPSRFVDELPLPLVRVRLQAPERPDLLARRAPRRPGHSDRSVL